MSVPSSVEELLQLIRKSGMIDDAKLNNYLARREVGRGNLPDDAREAADALVRDGVITYFQAEQYLLGKWRGFTIGKYKLLERVGVGGMGQVFLCEHMYMKKHVAVKVLPPAKAEQPAALGRFYREARAAGSLDHPNIARTHDIDQDGNLHYIVMEYVNGLNLLDTVRKFGPMSPGRAAYYVRQVAAGLDYAFRAGIIHRDVKPGNILVDRDGTAKILDMGLARFYKDTTDLLTVKYDDKIVLGTADYVAPEQVANSHGADVRADVYALGASLYFLLAGHPPFPSGTVSQKLLWHRTKDPTPIHQIRADVPDGLAVVVARMMAKSPAERYQTPAEVYAALAPFADAAVPPPAADELPQLSLAAAESLGLTAPKAEELVPELVPAGAPSGGSSVTRSTLLRRSAPAADSALAGGSSVTRSTLLKRTVPPPSGPFAPPVRLAAAPPTPLNEPPPAVRFGPSPFAPPQPPPALQAEVNTAGMRAADPTPSPTPHPTPRSPAATPFAPPPFAPAPVAGPWSALNVALVVLTVVTAAVGAGVLYLQFGR